MEEEKEYQEIASLLQSRGLNWILTDVEADIRAGKVAVARRQTVKEDVLEGGQSLSEGKRFSVSRLEEFTVRELYTQKEQLALLYEAVRRVVADPILMQSHVGVTLGSEVTGIAFLPEDPTAPDEMGESHELNIRPPKNRVSEMQKVIQDIDHRLRELSQ